LIRVELIAFKNEGKKKRMMMKRRWQLHNSLSIV
jgi:hypothetical protein